MDPVSLAVGGVLIAAGWFLGRLTRRPRVTTAQLTSLTVCSRGHGYGSHENGARCAAQVDRPHYMKHGERNGREWVPCPCLSYDGPEPLPRVWTGEPPVIPPPGDPR